MSRVELLPLPGLPEVAPGDDLAALILAAAEGADLQLRDGDVLAVAQKVVSKAEGAVAAVPAEPVGAVDPRRALARQQAARIVADTPWVLITETPHGFVCANGGVDASNVAEGQLVLLPEDPDGSAARLRAAFSAVGVDIGVIVTDTFGRPWRMGQTEVAIGAAGIEVLRDERGGTDRHGRELEVTVTAIADELAAAADLVRTKASGTPVVVIRGLDVLRGGADGAVRLVRPAGEDLFRHGGPTAIEAALLATVDDDRLPATSEPIVRVRDVVLRATGVQLGEDLGLPEGVGADSAAALARDVLVRAHGLPPGQG